MTVNHLQYLGRSIPTLDTHPIENSMYMQEGQMPTRDLELESKPPQQSPWCNLLRPMLLKENRCGTEINGEFQALVSDKFEGEKKKKKSLTGHGENANQDVDVAAPDDGDFTLVASAFLLFILWFAWRQDPSDQDNGVKSNHRHKSTHMHCHVYREEHVNVETQNIR